MNIFRKIKNWQRERKIASFLAETQQKTAYIKEKINEGWSITIVGKVPGNLVFGYEGKVVLYRDNAARLFSKILDCKVTPEEVTLEDIESSYRYLTGPKGLVYIYRKDSREYYIEIDEYGEYGLLFPNVYTYTLMKSERYEIIAYSQGLKRGLVLKVLIENQDVCPKGLCYKDEVVKLYNEKPLDLRVLMDINYFIHNGQK